MKILYILFLSIFIIKIDTYGQNIEFENFDYTEDELKYKSDNQSNIAEDSYATPLLIPLKKDQVRTPIIIHVDGINKEMSLEVALNVRFLNDLKKSKNVKIKYVYLSWIRINNNRVISPDRIKSKEDFIVWNIVSEKFINWMYNQPFDDYYNRTNIYPYYEEVPALSFRYKVTIIPKQSEQS